MQSLKNGDVPEPLKGKASPVFTESRQGGMMRTLPGNIVISFRPDWNRSKIDSFVISNNLQVIDKMKISGNIYLIRTESGLGALILANKIRTMSGVIAAYPNWWVQMQPR